MKPYLNQVSGKIDKDVNLFTGGINTYVNRAFIEDNQLSYAMNVGMYEPPKLSTRPSRLTLAWFFQDKTNYAPYSDTRVMNIFTYSENEIFTIVRKDNGDTFLDKYVKGENYFEKKSVCTLPTYDNYYMCYCRQATNEYLYIMNENFKGRIEVNSENLDFKEYNDGIYGIPAFHKGRLFIADTANNVVAFSALYDFDNFALINNNYIIVEELPTENIKTDAIYVMAKNETQYYQYYWWNDTAWKKMNELIEKDDMKIDYSIIAGDFKVTNGRGKIVALKSFDNKLVIFCEHSMHVLYGDSPNVEINFFTLVDLNNDIGGLSERAIAIGSGILYWLGDDLNIYEYTGAYINIISRPSEYVKGGIEGIIHSDWFLNRVYLKNVQFACASGKLYINLPSNPAVSTENDLLFVYDTHNKIWWCEDGKFTAISEYQATVGTVLLARVGGDLLLSKDKMTGEKDYIFNVETQAIEEKMIEYAFETKVYGIDGVSMRKSLTNIWVQASAVADVYVGDYWTAVNHWIDYEGFSLEGYLKVGKIIPSLQPRTTEYYESAKYESQRIIIPKMHVERVNGFSILIKGEGIGEFYLMEREWRAI